MGLALIAGYYRIAADPAQLKHQLALIGRFADAEDLVRGANMLGLEVAHPARASTPRGSAPSPIPRCCGRKDGGFIALGVGSAKGRVRIVDPVTPRRQPTFRWRRPGRRAAARSC